MEKSSNVSKGHWPRTQTYSAIRRNSSGSNSNSGRESVRPFTNKSFTPGKITPASSRPVTQQGMTGVQTPRTSGTGLNRQYRDKRYYISLIHNHMLIIKEELKRLQKRLSENKVQATNYEECKRQAESYSKQLAELEESLIIYNTAIECSMYKKSRNNLEEQTEKFRRSNQQKITQLESTFSEKIVREEQLSKIQQQIELETQAFNDMVTTFPEKERQQYYGLWQKNEDLKNEEDKLRNEINQMKKYIGLYEQNIFQNEFKRTRYNLMTKYSELNKRHEKLREENKVKRTPSEEREYLLEQVKQDRADMQSFKSQREELNTELEKLKERHSDLEDELSEKNSARLNKFKELLRRQETMEKFIDTFEDTFGEQVDKLSQQRLSIVFSLEYISGNSIDANFDDIDNTQSYVFNPGVSKEELKQEYKKLSAQLNMLNFVKNRFDKNLDTLKEQDKMYKSELSVYDDIEHAREELLDRQSVLELQIESLKSVLKATRAAVKEAEIKSFDIEAQLQVNEDYAILNELEKQLDSSRELTEKQAAAVESIRMMDNYEQIKNEAMGHVHNIFTNIQGRLKYRK